MELISVIVPVFKVEKYLDRCVQSIADQTYRNLEIILVDDGTRDASDKICDAYAARDSRIRAVHKLKNEGVSCARNDALELASGEYLLFVDSDDLWTDDNALRDIYDILCKEGMADVVLFGVSVYASDGTLVKQRIPICERGTKREVLEQLGEERLQYPQ